MKQIASSFSWGKTEYVLLKRSDRPLLVESSRLDEAFMSGAESYPLVCNADLECWLEIPDEHYQIITEEFDWILQTASPRRNPVELE